MFNDKETALNFLKSLSSIIMPPQFTYLNHCTFYLPEQYRENFYRRTWSEFPKDGFSVHGEMSFTERDKRIAEALSHGGAHNAPTRYSAPSQPHFPFIIRVIIPTQNNNLNLPEQYQKELQEIYTDRGSNRHPKLYSGEKIIMFASASKDEVSGKEIDILYGIREQDILIYANTVFLELLKCKKFNEAKMPEVQEQEVTIPSEFLTIKKTIYKYDPDFEFAKQTYIIPKDQNTYKYEKKQIVDKNYVVQATMLPKYENINTSRKSR